MLVLLVCGMTMGPQFVAGGKTVPTQANVMVELQFTAARHHPDPFNDVALDLVVSGENGSRMRIPAFWAGSNVWKARFSSPLPGRHRFVTECSDARDSGLHGIKGTIEVAPYTGTNANYRHGSLRVAESKRYLEHADGTPFFWLADTWWMGLCQRLHWPDEFKRLAVDRKTKGFNVVQIVAGLYPDMFPFDPRGANEAGFPWTTNYGSIRPEYFNAADERILYLADQGFTPCIFGAWGHYLAGMGLDKTRQHWRYLIARYGALPVIWSAAGEANLPWYLVKDFPYDDRQLAREWTEVMRYIRATDPFHRPLTVHPTGLHRFSSRNVCDDPTLFDLDILQTPHGLRGAVPKTVETVLESYCDSPVMPVIDAEASYEMLVVPKGIVSTEWTRRMLWTCLMNGAAGHTYGANGIWQCNRTGQPHGPSPTAGSPATGYGAIPWDEAMNLPGSGQAGIAKGFLEQFPWYCFEPHPEWAEFVSKDSLTFDGCHWIWFPEGNPAQSAPVAKRYFRRMFELPAGQRITKAQLRVSADDQFAAWLNGESLGSGANFKFGRQFNELTSVLKPGTNVLSVMAENLPGPELNPAGLLARLEMTTEDGQRISVVSDASWTCAKVGSNGWTLANCDNSSWTNVQTVGNYGDKPWEQVEPLRNDGVYGPQCAGIAGVLRMIYVPQPDTIRVRELGSNGRFSAAWFDPVSGERRPLASGCASTDGAWLCPPPARLDHDWVLIMEPQTTMPIAGPTNAERPVSRVARQ
ncbi:MAG TPA: DUF4038 domain-containing protein [Candidatus Dormibacteraeota bacterium]|nr:DUF4038 domain-containing protein [Candidatus Dormibacteraeota bacterium]